jgi:hypothetical protein
VSLSEVSDLPEESGWEECLTLSETISLEVLRLNYQCRCSRRRADAGRFAAWCRLGRYVAKLKARYSESTPS